MSGIDAEGMATEFVRLADQRATQCDDEVPHEPGVKPGMQEE